MKTLLILLLLGACGKQEERQDYYRVDPQSLKADSDGDGVLDWDEIHAGRDPLLADVDSTLPSFEREAVLKTVQGEELKVLLSPQRPLRGALLRSVVLAPEELPRETRLTLSARAAEAFWRARLQGARFTSLEVHSRGQTATHPLSEDFDGAFTLTAPISPDRYRILFQRTYRLVVSLPDRELVFFLSPSVSPRTFLARRFALNFDEQGAVTGLLGFTQQPGHEAGFEASDEAWLWRVHGPWDRRLAGSPRPGDTVALVGGAAREFREAYSSARSFSHDEPWLAANPFAHEAALIVHLPAAEEAQWSERRDTIEYGHHDREQSCVFSTRRLSGYLRLPLRSAERLLAALRISGAQNVKLEWWAQGPLGVAARLALFLPSQSVGVGLSPDYLSALLPLGVVKTDCPRLKPLSRESAPWRRAVSGRFHWQREDEGR